MTGGMDYTNPSHPTLTYSTGYIPGEILNCGNSTLSMSQTIPLVVRTPRHSAMDWLICGSLPKEKNTVCPCNVLTCAGIRRRRGSLMPAETW